MKMHSLSQTTSIVIALTLTAVMAATTVARDFEPQNIGSYSTKKFEIKKFQISN